MRHIIMLTEAPLPSVAIPCYFSADLTNLEDASHALGLDRRALWSPDPLWGQVELLYDLPGCLYGLKMADVVCIGSAAKDGPFLCIDRNSWYSRT
jgi:hypothetical protein